MNNLCRYLIVFFLFLLLSFSSASLLAGGKALNDPFLSSGFDITEVGTLGGNSSTLLDINDRGTVVGQSYTAQGEAHAFLWTKRDGFVDLHEALAPDLWISNAYALNNRGQVLVAMSDGNFGGRHFLWSGKNQFQELPFLPDVYGGLNDHGTVIGTVFQNDYAQAVRWDGENGLVFLSPSPNQDSFARDINNAGLGVGYGTFGFPSVRAAFFSSPGKVELANPEMSGLIFSINERNEAVGKIGSGQATRGAFWKETGELIQLLPLAGDSRAEAKDVNDCGIAVGFSRDENYNQKAVLWLGKTAVDLNEFLPADSNLEFREARAINNRGQMAVTGRANGQVRGFILSAKSKRSFSNFCR